jgi:hypothetical protein
MLVAGTLDRAQWPELDDEDFAVEVRERLSAVGLELVGAAGKWLARPVHVPTDDIDGFEPAFALNSVELAVVAALYLHLRYLPRQGGGSETNEEPSVAVEELLRAFPGYSGRFISQIVVGHLRNAGFVRRENDRLYAGPYLAALNEIEADERAQVAVGNFQLRSYLKRRAEELEGQHAPG